MAENTTTIEAIQINTQPSVKSIRELRKELKDMQSQLLSLDKDSKEYSDLLLEIGNRQHDLKEITEEVARTNQDFGDTMSNVRGSIAGVSGAIQTVTGVLALMGVEAGKDSKLLKVMVAAMSITSGVQAIDSGIKAFRALTITIKASTAAAGGLGKALKALAYSNPFTAILAAATAVVAVVAKISSASSEAAEKAREEMEKTDERMREIAENMKTYFADTFKVDVDTTVDDMERILKAEDKVFEQQYKEAQAVGAMVMTETQGMLEMSINSFKSARKLALQSNPAWDYTAEGKKAFKEYYANIMELAKVKFREIRFETGKEAEKLRQQYVDEYNKAEKELGNVDKKAAEYQQKKRDEAKAAAKARADELKRQAQNEITYLQKEIALVKERYEEKGETKYIPQLAALYDTLLEKQKAQVAAKVKAKEITQEQGDIEIQTLERATEKARKEMEQVQKDIALKETDKKATQQQLDLNAKIYEQTKAYYEKELQLYAQLNDAKTTELQALAIEKEQNETAFALQIQQINDRIAALQQLQTLYADQPDKVAEYANEITELQQEITDVEQEQAKKRIDIAKKEAEAKKNINKKYVQAYQQVSGSVSSILGSMSDQMEEGTEQWKNLKIAQAIIDTLAGSVTAFTTAMELGVPLGPIVGAAQMAAVLATGFATVAEIRNTEVNKNSAGGATTPSISVSDQAVNALNSQASNVRLTNTQNDVIDLGETMKQVKVVVSAREITEVQDNTKKVQVANTF